MPLDDGTELLDILRPLYIELLAGGWDNGGAAVGFADPFTLENENVQRVLEELATRVKGITETTRERIRELVGQSAREGWSVDDLRQRIDESGVFGAARAEMIAVTETAAAYSRGSLLAYQESGVVSGVEWLIADEACEICGPLAGQVVALGEAFAEGIDHPPAHPACRCAVAPRLTEG